jgi:hypothetical protein
VVSISYDLNGSLQSTQGSNTFVTGDFDIEYDIRFKKSSSTGITLWTYINGSLHEKHTEPGATADFTADPDLFYLGNTYNYGNGGSGSDVGAIKMVRINRTALSDAEIEAWT